MLGILKRGWVVLVVAMVVALGSVAVVRLRGVFGSDAIFSSAASRAEQLPQVNLKRVTYEVLGPGGTAGRVSYLNEDSQPEHADFVQPALDLHDDDDDVVGDRQRRGARRQRQHRMPHHG